MLHILVHTDIPMKFWYCISVTYLFQNFISSCKISMASCNHFSTYIHNSDISCRCRQLKYSTFLTILLWSALGNSSYVLIHRSDPSSLKCIMRYKICTNVLIFIEVFVECLSFTAWRHQIQYHDSHYLKCNLTFSHLNGRIHTDCNCICVNRFAKRGFPHAPIYQL